MNRKTALHAAGLKATANRQRVLEILDAHDHLSARAVWERLLRDKEPVGFATVYRILSVLCEVGLLRKIPAESGALYESTQDGVLPQLICSRCGKSEEVDDPELLRYNASVMKNRSLPEQESVLIYANCNKKTCTSETQDDKARAKRRS